MSPGTRLGAAVTGAVALQTACLAGLRPPGQRLRAVVDVLAVEGLVLALVGALLLADRPFLATRRLLGLGGESRPGAGVRGAGRLSLITGGALFAAAALAWSLAGTR
ncbi:MAG: hypothetical protein ACT4PE_17140 [Candidatus Eiseniibacteriota bacterium]